ncbi:MAG: hypothetical protein GYA59_04165 [Chloroflexi bacterium]|nr:hypothetical protein [Chloroflexota bacterium]
MASTTASQSFEEKLYQANRMPPRPEFLASLRARLVEQPPRPLSLRERLRVAFLKPGWGMALVVIFLLLAALLAIGPQRALAAFRQLFGYIPGVGLVDTRAPIRVLAEPVSQTRQGITLSVTSAVLTGDRTHIDYRLFGVPRSAYPDREDVHGCFQQEYLRLPDGTQLPLQNRDFPPLPAETNEAVLVISCISNTLPGKAPENWQLSLRFVPAPPDLTVVPVIESLPSPTPSPAASAAPSTTHTPTPPVNPLVITKVLDIGDKFVLMGEFRYNAAQDASLPAGSWWALQRISIAGADGREVPQSYSNDFELPTPSQPNSEAWLYQLDKNFVPPVTITYAGELISPVGAKEQASFEFDAGQNPQDGANWNVNKDFHLGGYNIRLLSVESSSRGYVFHFKADPGASANAIQVSIVGYTPNCGGGGGGDQFPEEFDANVCYAGMPGGPEFPHGSLEIVLSFQALRRQSQSFQVQWSPDAAQTGPFATSTPQPGVCLDSASLAQLGPAPAALSGGKALFYEPLPGGDPWGLVLYNLDGSQKRVLAADASWGALSPDGRQVAYPAADGIHLIDLATQDERVLRGANGFDLHWSPDSQQIAYIGSSSTGANNLFIVNAAGGPARQVSEWSYEAVVGWSPDGSQLYFVAPYTGGAAWKVYAFDLASGVEQERFTIENGTPKFLNARLSPDGNWITYRGRDNSSLYLVRTDGSDRHPVLGNIGVVGVAWSQLGWLGASLGASNSEEATVVLIQPDGCEVYRLPALHGELQGLWTP